MWDEYEKTAGSSLESGKTQWYCPIECALPVLVSFVCRHAKQGTDHTSTDALSRLQTGQILIETIYSESTYSTPPKPDQS